MKPETTHTLLTASSSITKDSSDNLFTATTIKKRHTNVIHLLLLSTGEIM